MPINTGYLTANKTKTGDEQLTPRYAVEPILKYLDKHKTVWCPFDKEDSEYVKVLKENGFNVINTHIDFEQDFLNYEPTELYDIIISNPPFSIKDKVLKRLNELNKPYAMLLPLPTLQGQSRFQDIKDCQALIFDKRIKFIQNGKVRKCTCICQYIYLQKFTTKRLDF